jgi:hypothetical protein
VRGTESVAAQAPNPAFRSIEAPPRSTPTVTRRALRSCRVWPAVWENTLATVCEASADDTFQGFGSFRRSHRWDRCAAVCLTVAFRSQGFSPSQRLDPPMVSRTCFIPHPPIGFRGLQSFSPATQPPHLVDGTLLSWCSAIPKSLVSLAHGPATASSRPRLGF